MITSMIFFPEKTFYEKPQDYGFDWEDVSIQTADGVSLHGWFLKAKPEEGVLLFFHGNAGNISGRLFKAQGWVKRGFSVLLLDYRGYGKSAGSIQRGSDIVLDGEAARDWLIQNKKIRPERLILYGESLGSYPAVRLAHQPFLALILESPFTSFQDLAMKHYSLIPGMVRNSLISDFKYPNIDYIADIKTPVFILHGTRDEICPYEMGEKLFEKAPEPKGFLSIPNGKHNDLPMAAGEDYWQKPYEFVLKRIGNPSA